MQSFRRDAVHRSCDRMGRQVAGRDPRLQGASARLAAAELLLEAVLVPQVWHPTRSSIWSAPLPSLLHIYSVQNAQRIMQNFK